MRKWRQPPVFRVLVLPLLALTLAGCATKGPLHVYAIPGGGDRPIVDVGNGRTSQQDSYLERGDQLTGFAYDPFTDHFFLRLAPGNRIRVVDRPARAIKREFDLATAPTRSGGGDVAVRPRDGHLFLLLPDSGEILETTRLGKVLRTITPAGIKERLSGLAYDSGRNHLLLLDATGRRVTVHDPAGAFLRELQLAEPAGPALAFDAEQREFYAPLASGGLGVFDEEGRRVRTLDLRGTFIDVGPRSFVRVF